jgi:DNA-binding MarR family transcriptional regulator
MRKPRAKNRDEKADEIDFGKLPRYLGYQIRQAQSALFRDLSRSIRALGLTPGEFSLLAMLEVNPGLSSMRLARVYQLDKTSLSLALKRLAERGLIESNRNAADRRYHSLRMTPAGRTALRRATRHVEAQERAMDAVLAPGQRELLLDLLARIAGEFRR